MSRTARARSSPGELSTVRVDQPSPEVRVLTMDRPERLNALNYQLVADLHTALRDLKSDRTTRVVILTGAGRGFCSGLDLKEIGPSPISEGLKGPAAGLATQVHIASLIPELRSIPQIVIAAINGPAYGGGLAIACGCDIRIAAESAHMGVQFIKVGVSGCDIGISYTLPRLVGVSRAHELILTARRFEASEALQIGLVSRVVPDGELLATAEGVAETILGYSPFAVTMTKEVMWANVDAPNLDSAIHLENRTQILASTTGAVERAARAFSK